jgi:hypothetical protein
MSLRKNQSDKRKDPSMRPNISWESIIRSHFKDVFAFIIIILLIIVLANKGSTISDGLNSFLYSMGGAAVGFLFGNNSNS